MNCCEKLVQTFNFFLRNCLLFIIQIYSHTLGVGRQTKFNKVTRTFCSIVCIVHIVSAHTHTEKAITMRNFHTNVKTKSYITVHCDPTFGGGQNESENGTDRGKDISPNIYWHTLTTIKGDDSVFPLRLIIGLQHELSNFA